MAWVRCRRRRTAARLRALQSERISARPRLCARRIGGRPRPATAARRRSCSSAALPATARRASAPWSRKSDDLGHRAEAELARRRAGEQAPHHRRAVGDPLRLGATASATPSRCSMRLDVEAGRRAVEDHRIGAPQRGLQRLDAADVGRRRRRGGRDADADLADRRARRAGVGVPVAASSSSAPCGTTSTSAAGAGARRASRSAGAAAKSRSRPCGRSRARTRRARVGCPARPRRPKERCSSSACSGRRTPQEDAMRARARDRQERRAARMRFDSAGARAEPRQQLGLRLGPLAGGHAVHHRVADRAVAAHARGGAARRPSSRRAARSRAGSRS